MISETAQVSQNCAAPPIETCSSAAGFLAWNLGNGANSSKRLQTTSPFPHADRVALAQPQVDDPEDTDLQEHEKVWNGKSFFRVNSTANKVPQV